MTRKKLKIGGEAYGKLLSEYLQTIPSYLGGQCICERCSEIGISNMRQFTHRNQITRSESTESICDGENSLLLDQYYETGVDLNWNCDQVVRTAMISILIFWVFVALIAGIYDPETRPFFPSTWGKTTRATPFSFLYGLRTCSSKKKIHIGMS